MPQTNKVKITIEMTNEQKKDFMKAIEMIMREGTKDEGRACQLLSADYFSGHQI